MPTYHQRNVPDESTKIPNRIWLLAGLAAGPGHWPVPGANTLRVILRFRDPDVTPQLYIRDVETEIKYLMGKNYDRGQDDDLGPYEHAMI